MGQSHRRPPDRWLLVAVLVSGLASLAPGGSLAGQVIAGPVPGIETVAPSGGTCAGGSQTFPVTVTKTGDTLTIVSPGGSSTGPISPDAKSATTTGPGGTYRIVADSPTHLTIAEDFKGCSYQGTIILQQPLPLVAETPATPNPRSTVEPPTRGIPPTPSAGGTSLDWLWGFLLGLGLLMAVAGLFLIARLGKPDDGLDNGDDGDPRQCEVLEVDDAQEAKDPAAAAPAPPKCRWALLIGAGFRRPDETGRHEESVEAKAIERDATEKLAPPLVENWGFAPRRVKKLTNRLATKANIETAFSDLLGELTAAQYCPDCYVKIHLQGHASLANPSFAKKLVKGAAVPAGRDSRLGFRTWDTRENLSQALADGLLYDFEFETMVKRLRDELAKQKAAPGSKLKKTQVIVQADMCFGEEMLQGLAGQAGIATAWATSLGETQGYEPAKGSTWAQGFHDAFADENGNVDPAKRVTVEAAHQAAGKGVEEGVKKLKASMPLNEQSKQLHPHPGQNGPNDLKDLDFRG